MHLPSVGMRGRRGTIAVVGRLFSWIVGLLGALAVWRLWSRRRREAPVAEPDPADELRRKLAATRDEAPAAPDDPDPEESLEERRARVHAKAQETIDSMHEDKT